MAAEGSDFAGVTDVDPALRVSSGRRALGEAVARRLSTPLGALPDWPSYGYDLTTLIGTSVRDEIIRQNVRAQCIAEEEIERVNISINRPNSSALELAIQLFDAEGPFDLTVLVDELDVTAIIPET